MPKGNDRLRARVFDSETFVVRNLTPEQREDEAFWVNRRIGRIKANEFSTDEETEQLRTMLRSMLLGIELPEPEPEPELPATVEPEQPKKNPNRQPPCGTVQAYRRHYRYNEPLDDECAEAGRLDRMERKQRLLRKASCPNEA